VTPQYTFGRALSCLLGISALAIAAARPAAAVTWTVAATGNVASPTDGSTFNAVNGFAVVHAASSDHRVSISNALAQDAFFVKWHMSIWVDSTKLASDEEDTGVFVTTNMNGFWQHEAGGVGVASLASDPSVAVGDNHAAKAHADITATKAGVQRSGNSDATVHFNVH
jgi:hypothetical protein